MMNEKFMKKALRLAEKAGKLGEVPIGAVIVKDGVVLSSAYNMRNAKKSATKHAEIIAITKASKKINTWHLDDCIMYVTLEPCPMCAGALIQSRIKKVIYGAKSFQDGAIESALHLYEVKGFNHYPETLYFDELEECSKIISNYFKTKR